jgi:uroporphyrinogen-III synthase
MRETVVITASADSLSGLTDALRAIPVAVEEHPLLSFEEPADWTSVDSALKHWTRYGAVAFTSPRAAAAVAGRAQRGGMPRMQAERAPVIWAGGSATAAALGRAMGAVLAPPEPETARLGAAAALAEAMLAGGVVGPVLFPCGEMRREELPERLRRQGIVVDEVVCYRTVLSGDSEARAAAAKGTVLVVTSPRVAALLAGACPTRDRPRLIAVGPTTAAAAREAGWLPAGVASAPNVAAVVTTVRDVIASHRAGG